MEPEDEPATLLNEDSNEDTNDNLTENTNNVSHTPGMSRSLLDLLERLGINRVFGVLIILIPGLIVLAGWPEAPPSRNTPAIVFNQDNSEKKEEDKIKLNEPIQPIPLKKELDSRLVKVGKALFFDTRLSRDNTVSCATCHNLEQKGGADGLKLAQGIGNRKGGINTPTVFNAELNFRQFWDGRAANLEEQIDGPVNNPMEMGTNWKEVIPKLMADVELKQSFKEIFGGKSITPSMVKSAIAEFERSLSTPNSRFDKYLRGKANVLTDEEIEGYRLFKNNGCVACHQGVNIGGNMYQTFGVMGDYFKERGGPITEADRGRENVTGNPKDRHIFKVPSLRNVALTAPYFHDGSAQTLADAVRVMARFQLGRSLEDTEVRLIVKFLQTLTGEYEGKPL